MQVNGKCIQESNTKCDQLKTQSASVLSKRINEKPSEGKAKKKKKALFHVLTCCRPLRSICFQNWKSKQRSLQYLQTREAHKQRSFTVKWESTCKEKNTKKCMGINYLSMSIFRVIPPKKSLANENVNIT